MSVSVIIPCIKAHIHSAEHIVDCYKRGTVVPKQIIIVLSGCNACDAVTLTRSGAGVVLFDKLLERGLARNIGTKYANGDILIFNDADDIPHPQRNEIVLNEMENSNIMLLSHMYCNVESDFVPIAGYNRTESDELFKAMFPGGDYSSASGGGRYYGNRLSIDSNSGGPCVGVHGANIAVKRKVFESIRWRTASELTLNQSCQVSEDYEFCCEVLYTFRQSVLLHCALCTYDNHFRNRLT